MSGKRAIVGLIAVLLAFGYVFTLNPGMVEFQIYPGSKVSTSLALVLFLFALGGFGAALLVSAFKEAARSFVFWRHRKGDLRREEGKRLLVAGRGQMALGKTRTARRLLQRAQRKMGREVLVALEVARVELAEGRFEKAAQSLRGLLEVDPNNPEILSLLLETYRKRGDFEGQVATLRRRLEGDPDHLPSYRGLRDLYEDARNWAEAARIQEQIVTRVQGRSARVEERRRLGELRLLQAKSLSPEQARGQLDRLAKDQDEFAPAHAALGEALAAAGNPEGAVAAWLRGYHTTGQTGLLLQVERLRLEEGKGADLVKLYQKLGRKNAAVTLLLGRLLLRLERSQEALTVLEKAAEEVRASKAGRRITGEALFRLRSYDEAAKAFREGSGAAASELPLEFTCGHCHNLETAWSPRCPRCEKFDSLQLSLEPASTRIALLPAG